jgi:Domain of unknown function (DUF4082)/Purple acid Phosphatase, N-terminal domain
MRVRNRLLLLSFVVFAWGLLISTPAALGQSCPPGSNAIVCENLQQGTPQSVWDISGAGDLSIQGFGTDISVNVGGTISFKVDTTASAYHIDIYRLGYYGGNGARLITTIKPSVSLPQTQPACLTDSTTGLIDCGNWAVSASWTVPATAVSGVYLGRLVRNDTGGASHMVFVVRNDSSHSQILFQTIDTAWQAYNDYGGNNLYTSPSTSLPGRAYKVSYNRPYDTRVYEAASWLFNGEYPMIRWLEANGYDVTYSTGLDADRNGSLIQNHKIYLGAGHDEYWSNNQRANMQAAANGGVNLAFFSGNLMFWKTRWENSIDGTNTPYRTVVCYKETHANAVIDPLDPPTWTGTWRDPRFSPPADGGRPENAVFGPMFMMNAPRSDSIVVTQADGQLRFWRNTAAASLPANQSYSTPEGTLGYEWDAIVDNGFLPAGPVWLSTWTTTTPSDWLLDYGNNYGAGTGTHRMVLHRVPGGGLVFGAGTVQWSWGLDATHDGESTPTDVNMQQATVNLLADMSAQPGSLQGGLVQATASTDTTPPVSTITSPSGGTNVTQGQAITITGTATDFGGGHVGGVEVSTDGGNTWHPATGRSTWSYGWTPTTPGPATIRSRAVDDSANLETPSPGVTVNSTPRPCPCTIWAPTSAPTVAAAGDSSALEVGVKFRSDVDGYITGVRFYKSSTNTGTHIGDLWDSSGDLLATATFTSETASGWQQVNFSTPVAISANTVYVASYHTNVGQYADDGNYFATSGVDNFPLHALENGVSGPNGVYVYSATSTFPTNTYSASNYWVDVVFSTVNAAPPTISNVTASSITDTTAVITWTTNEIASSQVNYGTTTAYGSSSPLNSSLVTSHSVTLTGLTASTVYHYEAVSQDSYGNVGASGDFTFTTAVAGTADPVISNVTASSITATGAVITWTTNSATTSQVNYGTTTAYGSSSPLNSAMVTSHSVTLKGLTGNTLYHYQVLSTDTYGNLTVSGDFTFTTAFPCCTIWPPTATPTTVSQNDPSATELGVKFYAGTNGYVTAIRFYKSSKNTGTHVGNLWDSNGNLLATATFTNETASGWQQVNFSIPVAVTANTVYIASYHTSVGYYSGDANYFATSGVSNSPLYAPANGVDGANGVYIYGATSAFPSKSYQSTNYWVDVMFTTVSTVPPTITNVGTSSITDTTALISWTTNEAANSQVNYGTTTAYGSSTALDSNSVTSHSETVSGLTANTTYHYQVLSRDSNGNLGVSADFTFTTAAPGSAFPVISSVGSSSITASGAVITWTTNEATTSQVNYGTTAAYGSSSSLDSSLVTSHSVTLSGLTGSTLYHYQVLSRDSSGNLTASGDYTFTTVAQCCTIWPPTATPTTVTQNDPSAVELGVKFYSNTNGFITAVRFYKSSLNTGTHIGNLWDNSGNLLATATFINETASGWQQVNFSTPVAVTANTVYVASYHTSVGYYSGDANYFATSGVTNLPLTAPENGADGPNGLYVYGANSAYPTNSYASTNFWVDVVFTTVSTVPPTITNVGASSITATTAVISWTTNEAANSQVNYDTTTAYGSSTALDSNSVTSHSETVSGLTASTLYHYQVLSRDSFGNLGTSGDFTFTTAAPGTAAPVISNVTASSITATTAVISWTTNEAANSQVNYGTTTAYGSSTTLDSNSVTSHSESLSGLTASTLYHYQVLSRDSAGNLTASGDFTFTTTASCPCTIWPPTATPATISQNDPSSVELGVKFHSDVNGTITGIRFYKSSSNTGTHVGNLWDSNGNLLATATFTNETASGWQQVNFSTPVAITANTVYLASYHTSVGFYSGDASYFATTGVDNSPLHAPANGVDGPNGVYIYGATSVYPTNSYQATNYWVDVVFSPGP